MRSELAESVDAFCKVTTHSSASIDLLKRYAVIIKALPENTNIVTLYQTLYVIRNFIATEHPGDSAINHFFSTIFSNAATAFAIEIDERVSPKHPEEWLCESGQFKLQALDGLFRTYHCAFQTIIGKNYRVPYQLFFTQQLFGILRRTGPNNELKVFEKAILYQINQRHYPVIDLPFARLEGYCNNPLYRTDPFFMNVLFTLKTMLCCTPLDDYQTIKKNIARWKQHITLGFSAQQDVLCATQNTIKDRHRLFSSREGDPLYFIENSLPLMLTEIQFNSLALTA